jgi:hypothetical protein
MDADSISFHGTFARSPADVNDMVDPSIRPGNLNLVCSQGLRVPTETQSPRRRREGFLDGIRLTATS